MQQQGGTVANVLQKLDVPIISTSICNSKEWYNGELTKKMICAGYEQGGKDACQGDSGGT